MQTYALNHVLTVVAAVCIMVLLLSRALPPAWAVEAVFGGVHAYTVALVAAYTNIPSGAAVAAPTHAVIPGTIVMSVPYVDELVEARVRTWQELNPEHTVKVFTDVNCADLIEMTYGVDARRLFWRARHGPIRADIFRVFFLYAFGGVYVDIDMVPLVPLSQIVPSTPIGPSLIVARSRESIPGKLNPTFMAATPRHPTLKAAVDVYYQLARRSLYTYWSWSVVHVMSTLKYAGAPINVTLIEVCPDWPRDRSTCVIQRPPSHRAVLKVRGNDYDSDKHAFRSDKVLASAR